MVEFTKPECLQLLVAYFINNMDVYGAQYIISTLTSYSMLNLPGELCKEITIGGKHVSSYVLDRLKVGAIQNSGVSSATRRLLIYKVAMTWPP